MLEQDKKNLMNFSYYDEAIDIMLQYVNKRDDIVTLWQYGKVTEPGVSDIDFIAVVSDNPNQDISEYLDRSNFDSQVITCINKANLIVVPESKSMEVFLWDKLNIIDLNSMRSVKEDKVIKNRQKYRDIAMLVDWAFILIYRFRVGNSNMLKINDRTALGRMKSFGYTINLFKKLGGELDYSYFSDLSNRLNNLRREWQNLHTEERKKEVHELYASYASYADDLHKSLFSFFSNSEHYRDVVNINNIELTFPKSSGKFVFTDSFIHNEDKVAIPISLLTHFYIYSSHHNSILSEKIQMSFNTSFNINYNNNEYYSFLSERIDAASVWFDYLKKNNFNFGAFRMGWYL
jgi:hypothetical protein